MWPTLLTLLRSVCSALRSRRHLALENLALRQQLALLRQRSKHPQFGRVDRVFWVWLSQRWSGWRDALCLVRPETVIRWHRAAWTAQQIVEAFPEESAPRYLLRDRDAVYGEVFRRRVECLGIAEVLTAARSPWQNPYAERMVGSLRRDLFDHVIVLGERHRRRLDSHLRYHHEARTHLSLAKDAPYSHVSRPPTSTSRSPPTTSTKLPFPRRTPEPIHAHK